MCACSVSVRFYERIDETFERCDELVAPATPYAAMFAGQKTVALDGAQTEIHPNRGVFMQPITLAGIPVVTVPVIEPGALRLGVQ